MTTAKATILLADDDANFQKVVSYNLDRLGYRVEIVGDGRAAMGRLQRGEIDLLLSDVRMPEMNGLELLREARKLYPELPIVLITAHGDIEMAVEALHAGATDFLTKPFERTVLQEKIERALRLVMLERENRVLRAELTDRHSFQNLIGSSPAMRELTEQMGRLAQVDTTVLLLGESGTGKEVVARALHYAGVRAAGSFVPVNCAAIPGELLESELFGHVKGAFTGADSAREGRFEQASGGTIFLDEIGDMPPPLQVKILRVLQERVVEPVGGTRSIPIDVRIVAATNQNLETLVKEGLFREDLYYRLNVVPLHIPPLRERKSDIALLARHFLKRLGAADLQVDDDALANLAAHDWPGNVRELENAIERAIALRKQPDRLSAGDFKLGPRSAPAANESPPLYILPDEGVVLDDLEKQLIVAALRRTEGNQSRAARLLGISRQKLIYRLQKHGIE